MEEEKHFCFVQNQLIFHSVLFLIWPSSPDKPTASLGKLRCGWPRLVTPYQKYEFQSFHPWRLSLCKKCKILIDSLQKCWWWSKNPAMWFEGRLFWSIDFPRKSSSVTLESLSFSNFMHIILSRKTNERIPRKVRYGRTDGRRTRNLLQDGCPASYRKY